MKTLSTLKQAEYYGGGRPGIASLRVASAVVNHETVTIGAFVYEASIDGTVTLPSNRIVDVSGSGSLAAAGGVLTSSANYANGETVTIGGVTYTFKTALTGAANEIFIGANEAASITNLVAAINGSAGAGTQYGLNTVAHPQVTAVAAAHTATLTARVKGTPANAVATTETCANASFANATLTGGVDAAAADFTTALTAAIKANQQEAVQPTRISANEVLVVTNHNGAQIALAETLSGANNQWANAVTQTYGERPDGVQTIVRLSRVATAAEVAMNTFHFVFARGFTPTLADVTVVGKAWDGTTTITGNRVTLTNTGATNIAANDVVKIEASN